MIRLGQMHRVGQIRWRVLQGVQLILAMWFFAIAFHPEQSLWPHQSIAVTWRLLAGALFVCFVLVAFIANPFSIYIYRKRGLQALIDSNRIRVFSVQSDLTAQWRGGLLLVGRRQALLWVRNRMVRIRSSEPSSEFLSEFAKCADDEARVADQIWRSPSTDRTISLPVNNRLVSIRFGDDRDLELISTVWDDPLLS